MLEVNIEKIVPVTEARDSLNKIIDEVSAGDELYVLTVNGKPSAVVVGVHHLEKLTGTKQEDIMNDDISQAPAAASTAPAAPSDTTPTASGSDDLFADENATAAPTTETATETTPAAPTPTLSYKPVEPEMPETPIPNQNSAPTPTATTPTGPTDQSNQFVTPTADDLTTPPQAPTDQTS